MGFPGFSKHGMAWLAEINENNNRDWFQANKPTYEQEVKLPLLKLVASLNEQIAATYPEYFLDDPAKGSFRIYRDTRFSKDKTPYKNHVSAAFSRRGVSEKGAGFYFQISAQSIGVAGGNYMPQPESLLAIRTRIFEHHEEFARITKEKKLLKLMGGLQGEQLRRVPKGFPPDHPAEDALRRKQFYYWAELDASLATTARLEKELLSRLQVLYPVMRFLDDAVMDLRKASQRQSRFLP